MTSPAVKAMIADLCAAADRYDRMHPKQAREWLVIADATPRFVTMPRPTTRLEVPQNGARPAGNRALTTTTDAKRSHRGCI